MTQSVTSRDIVQVCHRTPAWGALCLSEAVRPRGGLAKPGGAREFVLPVEGPPKSEHAAQCGFPV